MRTQRAKYDHCHCPNCKYDLTGHNGPRCPECGLELVDHDVFKTRRYPGVIWLPDWCARWGLPLILVLAAGLAILIGWMIGAGGVGVLIVEIVAGALGLAALALLVRAMLTAE